MNAPVRVDGLTFSVSQMKSWQLCPRKFELHYVIGADPQFVPMPLAFGSAFHSALAHHYSRLMRDEVAPVEEVKQRFLDEMTVAKTGPIPLQEDEEGTGFDEAIAKGLQMLDVTLSDPSSRPGKVLGVEVPFLVDIYDVDTGEVLDARLRGFVDLVLEEEQHRIVVEHKTSSRRYSLDQLIYDTQLSGYAFACSQMGWGEVGLRFQVTTKAKSPVLQIENVWRDECDQTDFLRTAAGVLKAIDAGISFPVRGWQCKSCPYKARCLAER